MASRLLTLILLLGLASTAGAQSQRTEHTLKLDDGATSPPATLADAHWLVGSWEGKAFGADFEEVWNPPSAGTMVGMYKVIRDGAVQFYELLLLVETEGSLAIKVKHFNPDFTAWEDKADYITFPLVRIDADALHFSGLSFHRIDDDTIQGYIAMRTRDGVREEPMSYRRTK